MYPEFQGKTAIASGAASGLGLAFCQSFAAEGGNVVLADINIEAAAREAEAINQKDGGRAIAVKCDVRRYEDVCAARDAAVEAFGRIDVVVNTAGGYCMRMLGIQMTGDWDFCDAPIEAYDWGLDVNLRGQMYFDHAVFGQMREQKSGVIIHVGSITGHEGSTVGLAYCPSKIAAAQGLTKVVAQAGARHGIRSFCVSPGPVLTRPEMANMGTLLGRAAQPQEIVDTMLFFASDKGAFVTGVDILVDGGRSLILP